MAFKMSTQKVTGTVNVVEIGTGDKAIKLGGEQVLPFYSFDGETGNAPVVGAEISDIQPEEWIDCYSKLYGDVWADPAKWAKYVEDNTEADFICLRLNGANPDGANKTPEECAEVAKAVAEAITLPLVVAGCGNAEKDGKVFDKVSAESAVDINLAKQMNVLLTQLGVQQENIVMNVGCSAVGYGYEYVASTMDRVRLAGFNQNDKALQIPIITPVSFEVGHVKEAIAPEADVPEWGDNEARTIGMEVSTAASVIVGGSNAVILRHPESIKTVKALISALA